MKKLTASIILLFSLAGHAQQYEIDCYRVAGGGGMSAGGQYSVTGTVGQHDAGGPLTGGDYSLTGGFWSLAVAVQTTGAPALSIARAGANGVFVSWPAPSTGFVLEQNTALVSAGWTTVTDVPAVVNGENQVTVSAPGGSRFYRLVRQ